ncbi:5'-3'-deoxyribonucleotidase [Paenibacillus sp. JSM ZJ436]|uniref:5' nucleotidase, NT5C type n=1 Tax=Paenibacillus sp. JSM ZJ436 TaxID=3376190 RepID=UPI0037950A30
MKKRISVDQDQVLAKTLEYWLDKYNNDYHDCLMPEQITEWNWHHLTHPKCQEKIYEYLDDPDLFLNLAVMEGSQEVLKELSYTYDIYVISAVYNPLNILAKHTWLKKHFPFLDEKKFVFTRDKSIVRAEYMLDDKPGNLESFLGEGKLLFTAPHNLNEDRFYRVNNWEEVRETLLDWK